MKKITQKKTIAQDIWLLPLAIAGLAVFCLFPLLYHYEKAEATIIEIKNIEQHGIEYCFEFITNHANKIVDCKNRTHSFDGYQIGDKIKVYYHPSFPQEVIKSRDFIIFSGVGLGGLLTFFLSIFQWVRKRFRDKKSKN